MDPIGYGEAPAAAGEIVQGQFRDGRDFLVSLPIDMWSRVKVELDEDEAGIQCADRSRQKAIRAAGLLLSELGKKDLGARISIQSEIPMGIGLASSTADITATCLAIGDALGVQIEAEEISRIAGKIEPSDGIMYRDLVCFDHVRCELIRHLGDVPAMDVLILNPGGTVDTITFNQIEKNYSTDEIRRLEAALEQLDKALAQGSNSGIGQAGTESALVNQRLLFKPDLERLIEMGKEFGCLGLSAGHSGTVINMLFDSGHDGLEGLRAAIKESELDFAATWRTRSVTQEIVGKRVGH